MTDKKGTGFLNKIKEGLNDFSKIVLTSLYPPITQGVEQLLDTIEERIKKTKKKLFSDISSFLIFLTGSFLLILSLFFFLVDQLHFSNALSFLLIGVLLLFVGFIIKTKRSN